MPIDDEQVRAALGAVHPSLRPIGELRRSAGYVNDLWFFDSASGPLVAKINNVAEEDPEQLRTYLSTMSLLARESFPTPELLSFEEHSEPLGGRQLSVLPIMPGRSAAEIYRDGASHDDHRRILHACGQLVGRLHTIALPLDTVWRDDCGRLQPSWPAVVRSSLDEALDELSARAPAADQPLINEVAARTSQAALDDSLDVSTPRLVHRDLHPGNFLIMEAQATALLDFELVREWDPAYDLVKLRRTFAEDSMDWTTLLAGYREIAAPSDAMLHRAELYAGWYGLLTAVDHLDGNDAYRDWSHRLQQWLAGLTPLDPP